MEKLLVLKFGGTSLADANRIEVVADIIAKTIFEDKVPLVIATHKELDQIDAREVMNHLVNLLGGSGGGRSDFAQGGIEKVEDIEMALASLSEFLVSLNS